MKESNCPTDAIHPKIKMLKGCALPYKTSWQPVRILSRACARLTRLYSPRQDIGMQKAAGRPIAKHVYPCASLARNQDGRATQKLTQVSVPIGVRPNRARAARATGLRWLSPVSGNTLTKFILQQVLPPISFVNSSQRLSSQLLLILTCWCF